MGYKGKRHDLYVDALKQPPVEHKGEMEDGYFYRPDPGDDRDRTGYEAWLERRELNRQRLLESMSHLTFDPSAVLNFHGGISYEPGPLETLKMISASSIFGEPQYYRDGKSAPKTAT